MKSIKTWVLVADGARAHIVVHDSRSKSLAPALAAEFAAPHAATREYGSDKPGRTFESADASRHAKEPRVDWHTFEKHLFAKDMAAMLDRAAERKAFDRLVLVAPAKAMGELRAALKPGTRELVAGELTKDLTHLSIHDLAEHLKGFLSIETPQPPRAPSA